MSGTSRWASWPGFVSILGSRAGAQEAAKQFLQGLQDKADEVEAWELRELDRLSRDVRGQTAKLREVLPMAEGLVLSSNNEYRKAVNKWKEVIATYEKHPEREPMPVRYLLYLEALLKLGHLYAIMDERGPGRAVILKAAAALARLDAGESLEPLRIRGSAEVGMVLGLLERPQEAVSFLDQALARSERYVARKKTPGPSGPAGDVPARQGDRRRGQRRPQGGAAGPGGPDDPASCRQAERSGRRIACGGGGPRRPGRGR